MAYTTFPGPTFTLPGTAAAFMNTRKRGTTGPVVTVAAPFFAGNGGGGTTPATYKLVAEGDSRTANETRNGDAMCWPTQLQNTLAGDLQYIGFDNFARGGDSTISGPDSIQASSAGQKAEVLTGKSTGAGVVNLLFIDLGINDLQYLTTPQATFAALRDLHAYYQSQGFLTAACTIPTSRNPGSPEHVELYRNTQRLNNLLRTEFNSGGLCTVLLDVVTDPALGGFDAPLNTTYYQADRIHYTTLGSTRRMAFSERCLPFFKAGQRKVINYTGVADQATIELVQGATVNAPVINSFSPASGPAGTMTTLNGLNLTSANLKMSGAVITPNSNTATQLVFPIPAGARRDFFVVTTPGGTVKSATAFTVPTVTPISYSTNFAGADGAIGDNWVTGYGSFSRVNNQAQGAIAYSFMYRPATEASNDQEVTVGFVWTGDGKTYAVLTRVSADGLSNYSHYLTDNGGSFALNSYRIDNNQSTTLREATFAGLVAGQEYRIVGRAVGGTITTQLKDLAGNVLATHSVDDLNPGGSPFIASGAGGIQAISAGATFRSFAMTSL